MSTARRLEPDPGPVLGEFPKGTREWTIMVYLAGDNNLEEYGRTDLMDMKRVGSSANVTIVAQFDRMRKGATRRYVLQQGTSLEEDEVDARLGETNTGDPRELALFLAWAIAEYPAKRHALILWNHGTGWKEDDLYSVAVRAGVDRVSKPGSLGPLVDAVACKDCPPLFSSTVDAVLARGIGYDDTSADFLDNAEMKRALSAGLLFGGIEKLDLLGFDACLMNMIEVAYQVRDLVTYVVGSQETEPAPGWPYGAILGELVAEPSMKGEGLVRAVADAYFDFYEPDASLTLSALDLTQIREVVAALNDMSGYILDNLDECELIVGRATRRAHRFADPDYKDLYDLCRQISERSDSLPELQLLAQDVMSTIEPTGPGRFVAGARARGPRTRNAHGVSIYFPAHEMSPFYKRLDFASESLWDEVLHAMLGV